HWFDTRNDYSGRLAKNATRGGRDYAGGDADFYKIATRNSLAHLSPPNVLKLSFAAPVLCLVFTQGAWRHAVYHNFTVDLHKARAIEHSKSLNISGRTTRVKSLGFDKQASNQVDHHS